MFSKDRLSAGQGQGFCQNNPLPTPGEGPPGSSAGLAVAAGQRPRQRPFPPARFRALERSALCALRHAGSEISVVFVPRSEECQHAGTALMMAVPALPRARSLARLAEGQVDPTGSKLRMAPLLQRLHAVKSQPRRPAPAPPVSMGTRNAP